MRSPFLLLLVAACPAPVESDTDTDVVVDPLACPFDADEGPGSAEILSPPASGTGYLCPLGDQDWLRVGGSGELLQLTASIEGSVSPVQPTWTVWDLGATQVLAGPEPDEAATTGSPLSLWHAVPDGPVLIQVRDQNNDGTDTRRAWQIDVARRAQPDVHEPNDETAVALPEGTVQGYVASRGDVDRFELDVTAQKVLRLDLSVPVGGFDPSLVVRDDAGVTLVTLSNPAGRREATQLTWTLAVEEDARLSLTLSDDDDRDHSPDVPWSLTWALLDDPDLSEPNDHPSVATALGEASCPTRWSEVATHPGYLATSGDVDWVSVDTSACGRDLIEATLSFDEGAASLPAGFTPTLRVVREVSGNPCSIDQDCVELTKSCGGPLDCEGIGNTCLGTGQCAGAAVCLPTGTCGANLLLERGTAGEDLRLSAPLPNLDTVWLAVAEQGGDQIAPETPYALTVRTRAEPDSFEPNNVYTAGPPTGSNAGRHVGRAVEIPVHDCRLPVEGDTDTDPPPPDCCDGPEDFVEGYLASAYDQDWFRYAHPCPGEDCMVRVHVEHDAGAVDVVAQIYRGSTLWYDEILPTIDQASQPARSVMYGGLEASDQCFYAYNGHKGSPFWYHLALRDTIFRGGSNPTGGTWEWSADQAYRVCVEVLADGCYEPPCKLFTDGCGS